MPWKNCGLFHGSGCTEKLDLTMEFAEIQPVGVEGIEKDLLLETIQVHREDTSYSREQFLDKFPVGSGLDISTTIEVTRLKSDNN